MSDLESKRRKFETQLDQLMAAYDPDAVSRQPAPTSPSLSGYEQRLADWEATLDRRLAEFWGEAVPEKTRVATADAQIVEPVEKPITPEPPVLPATRRPYVQSRDNLLVWLADLDHSILSELGFSRFSRPAGFQSPVQVLESDAAMRTAIHQTISGSPLIGSSIENLSKAEHLEQLHDHELGVFHAPGVGTLINLEHYTREHGLQNFEGNDPKVMAHVISEVARERWGWGFLLEYTQLGRQAGEAGLWPYLAAQRLGLPAGEGWSAATARTLRRAWLFLEAGWLDWIWQYTMFKARHPIGVGLLHQPRPGRAMELAIKFLDLFPLYIMPFGIKLRLRNLVDLLKYIFLEESSTGSGAYNQLLFRLQSFSVEHDQKAVEVIGQPLSHVLGQLYFARMESSIGIYAVPYAVLIAGYIDELQLSQDILPETLLDQIQSNPHASPDARLDMLAKIDSRVKYNPKALFVAAWERFRLQGPEQYFL